MAAVLTLRLSSPSFLETILTDNGIPLYSTETSGNTTTLSRCDPLYGLNVVAHIHWPEQRTRSSKGKCRGESSSRRHARITMNGSVCSEEDLLKRNRLNTSRKFRIPGHSETLKWRRVQGLFQCISSHGTPVAVFEPAVYTSTARMSVYVPTLPGLPEPQGCVSQPLLDYILVTALLLLTHPEDWHGFAVAAAASMSMPALASSANGLSMPRATPPPVPALQTTPPASPLVASPFSTDPHYSHFHHQQQQQGHQAHGARLSHVPSRAHLSVYSTASSSTSSESSYGGARIPPSPTSSSSRSSSARVSEKQRQLAVVNYDEPQPVSVSFAHAPGQVPQPHVHAHALALAVPVPAPLQLAQNAQIQAAYGEILPGEAPPPYEEHQWTVRVRQPRRRDQRTV